MQTNSKSIPITRPNHELVTKYLCEWSEQIVLMAKNKGIDTHDLSGDKATRKNFEGYLKKHKPSFVFLNGHGNANIITGFNNEPILDAQSAIPVSIIYARSCEAAASLGQKLVSLSIKSFVGYKRKFIFGYDPVKQFKPLNDTLAKLFLEPSNLVASTIIKGHTVSEAHSRSKSAMYKNFRRMLSSEATYEERFAARWLWSNINSQVILGDVNCRM